MSAEPALLIRGISLLSADSTKTAVSLTHGQFVLVRNGRFAYVGSSEAEALACLGSEAEPYHVYEGGERLLLPGFANAHSHLAMTLLRNAADDMKLHDWLFQAIFPKEALLRPEDVAVGTELGILELLLSGCTASADMYFFPEQAAEKALEHGFRLNLCVSGLKQEGENFKLQPARPEAFSAYCRSSAGFLRSSLLVHSVYLHPEKAYRELAELAASLDMDVQLHLGETQKERADCLSTYGVEPAAFLHQRGFFRRRTLAAHAVWLSEAEQTLLKGRPVYLVHNPSSNLKLASGLMPAQRYLDAGLKLALGTDGAASNNKLDMMSELRLAALLGKLPDLDPLALKAESAFLMATAWGYEALGFGDGGIIAAGALADFQILRLDEVPGFWPRQNLLAALVYSADRELIESVAVNGEFLIERKAAPRFDKEKLRADAQQAARHLCGQL